MKFAIIRSRFNEAITQGLLKGALDYLAEKGVPSDQVKIYEAPGAFELPLLAQEIAQHQRLSGVICLGAVIKGDTAHFEYISLAATMGIMNASLQTRTPISFGVLTTYNEDQALARSRKGDPENKGREAAQAAYESALFLKSVR